MKQKQGNLSEKQYYLYAVVGKTKNLTTLNSKRREKKSAGLQVKYTLCFSAQRVSVC